MIGEDAAHQQIDGRAALEGEHVICEYQRSDLREESRGVEIDLLQV
jgi:hypothetical protein